MKIDPTQSVKNQVKNYVKIRKGLRHSLPFQHGGKKCRSGSSINYLVAFGFRGASLKRQLPKLRRKAILVNVLHILDVVSSENRKKTFKFVLMFYQQATDRLPTHYQLSADYQPAGCLYFGQNLLAICRPLGYCISPTVPKTHGASFEVWFGFTRIEHLNFNSSVETSFSKCVCVVFDYCQFDCSLHIKCYFHS